MRATRTVSLIKDPDGVARARTVPAFELKVLKGPDKKKAQRFTDEKILIGAAEGAHFQLSDPTVSATHCEVSVDQQGYRVRDLGSRNGVELGGRKVIEAFLA